MIKCNIDTKNLSGFLWVVAHLSCASLCAFQLWWLIPGGAAGHFLWLQTCDLKAAVRLYLRGHGECGTARSAWCRGHRVWFSRARALPWLLKSSYSLLHRHPRDQPHPPPALLTALGPDYKISLVWSGLILEKHNPRLRVTPTGIRHHNRPTYRSLRTRFFPDEHILKPAGIRVVSRWATKWHKTANVQNIVWKILPDMDNGPELFSCQGSSDSLMPENFFHL